MENEAGTREVSITQNFMPVVVDCCRLMDFLSRLDCLKSVEEAATWKMFLLSLDLCIN